VIGYIKYGKGDDARKYFLTYLTLKVKNNEKMEFLMRNYRLKKITCKVLNYNAIRIYLNN
jgi:hypothetical protein